MKPTVKFNTRKQELLEGIRKLIDKHGYDSLTVRSICAELDISTGTFYHYFPEKSDIASLMYTAMDNYLSENVAPNFGDDEVENLINFITGYGVMGQKNGLESAKCISIAPLQNCSFPYLAHQRPIYVMLSGIIERGVQKGQFKIDTTVPQMTDMLLVIMRGYSSDWARQNGEYDLPNALNTFIKLFVRSIACGSTEST